MGTYTDTYVEMLQEDLQHQYRRCFEVGTDLAQALQASEAKDKELAKEREKNTVLQLEVRRRLNLQMDTTAKVERRLVDALGVLSDRDIEVERLTFALKDKDNELESVRDEHRTQIDELTDEGDQLRYALRLAGGERDDLKSLYAKTSAENNELMTELNDVKELYYNRLKIEEQQDEEIERLTRKNKKPFKAAELRWLIDGHTNVLDEHRTAILEVRGVIDQNKETLSAAQREMLATLDRHDALISKAFGCIDNHSDSIYKQQQSIDNLWLYVQGIAAHINTGGTPDGNQD